jgi:FlaA1/EpsC-like NDP-sugar epimerase
MLRIGGQRIPTRTLLVIVSDAVLITLGLTTAALVRFRHDSSLGHHFQSGQMFRFGIVVLVCIVALYYNDLYNAQVIRRHSELILRLLQALGTASLMLAVLYYFAPEQGMGRGIAALAAPIILVLLLGPRLLLDSTGFLMGGPERVLVLGTGPAGISLVREIISRPELHLKVVGFLD